MPFVMPEVVVRKILDYGIKKLRTDKVAFDDLFDMFVQDELANDYGPAYRDQIWSWFSTTKIPVIQAWSFNAQKIPCISVHLANETEDESKAGMSDFAGEFDEGIDTGTGAFTTMVDVGVHANRGGDHVLWMYYIVAYILFRHKLMANRLGLKLHTFSASDYSKESQYMTENIWTRWVRFRCTTQNFWGASDPSEPFEDINVEPAIGLEPASSVATSLDVDETTVDTTANQGLKASRISDPDDEDDLNI